MLRKIIIDTDPGIDDAVALLLALAAPEALAVLGIVAVAGNIALNLAARNARAVCALAGRGDVPVYAGCARPLGRALVTAEHIHGDGGLGPLVLPEPTAALRSGHGVDFLIDTLRRHEAQSVTLCALGPLTNIAMALIKAPDIAANVAELVMMGGAWRELGNITPAAEFNIHVDPHAAALVLDSGIPVTMLPLDVSHRVLTLDRHITKFFDLGNRSGGAVATLLLPAVRAARGSERYFGLGAPLHDPCVIAYLLCPELFDGHDVNVAVETASPLTLGMTVVDRWGVSGRPANVRFIDAVDAEGFYALLVERIARLP